MPLDAGMNNLTNFIVQRELLLVYICLDVQEILVLLWNQKIHYHFHKSPAVGPCPDPTQFNPLPRSIVV
jgi:hypothetical protein